MKEYKCLFFDLDRTLWDYEANSLEAFEDIIIDLHIENFIKDPALLKQIYNKVNEEMWDQYKKGDITKEFLSEERFNYTLKEFGINDSNIAQQFAKKYLEIVPTKSHLISGTIESLTYLKGKKYKLNIITNGFKEMQHKKLEHSRISQFFDNLIISEDVGFKKPHPKIFEYALNKCNVSKVDSIMIGDDYDADILGAANFGVDQVFYSANNVKIEKHLPTYWINDIAELIKIF